MNLAELDDMDHWVCWCKDIDSDNWVVEIKDKTGRAFNYSRAWGRSQEIILEYSGNVMVMVAVRRWESWV